MALNLDLNNLPANPEDLMKVFEQLEAGEEPKAPEPEPEPEKQEQSEDNQQDQDEQKAGQGQPEPEGEPQGIATKDGKHVIPYSVLKSERDRASKAEQLANEMRERVAALEAAVQAASQGAKDGESARTNASEQSVSDLSTDDLEALKEDFPTVYRAVQAAMAKAAQLEAKLQPVEDSVRSAEAEQARSATETVQDAIDSVPKLAHLQATNAEAFELAKQFDATLRTQSAWAGKPLQERFFKVAEMVEAALGPIDLPGAKPASQSAENLKAAAKAKADAAVKAGRTNVPTSLSEFPVGQHAAQDEREAAESMTALQLAEKFSAMTPDQMDAYFQTL
ncbi:hypothetical protein UFOVP653_60 [uncultured Caudovirales phage]|uniref:Uncharacterized protein n=1 Tax=uncultured Caudovirales phage TaxID=2100421 RepID=A0A6J5N942_9CAUD|nr:hypothetical protein UFOVP653_60 [uncultured Caudovirales phage]